MAFRGESLTNSSYELSTVLTSSSETVRSGENVKIAKGSQRPRVIVDVDIMESRFRAAWRNPLSDLDLLDKPLFAGWEFESLQSSGQDVGQTKARKPRNQAKKRTTTANIVGYERTIPPGVRGTFWW